jgi:hypothetical protein
MLINFRQGIINAQANFLQLVNGAVNIYVNVDKVDLAFAYGSHNYLFTESQQVNGAWTNLPTTSTAYLYWDINIVTGARTYGFTTVAPSFGSAFPTSPVINQHYFNFSTNKMYYWSGVTWTEVLRVFAGTVQNNAILNAYSTGSQVNLYGNYNIGYILFSQQNIALRVQDASNTYYFLTTEDQIYTQKDQFNAYKIDALLMDGKALEPIPAFSCVTWKGPKQLGLASYVNYQYPCVGIAVEVSGVGDVKQFVTKGFITNYGNWNFTQAPNTDLFVGQNGEITTTVPQQYSLQKIGHIVSPNTIYVNIDELVLIETIQTSFTPSVTPTMSASLSVTPTATFTPTPTVTASPTPTITPTITPTSTLFNTPVITVTASVTPSVTPSLTVSPTPTPSVTSSQSGPSYDQVIEADTPLAYWPLNTGLNDVIGDNNLNFVGDNLTYGVAEQNGVALVPDAYGNYAYFDSPNYGLPFTNQVSLTESFTLEAWIEIDSFSAAPPSDGYFTIFGTTLYGLQFNNQGQIYLYGNSDQVTCNFTLAVDTSYHVVVTVDSSNNVIFYFNGTAYTGSAALTDTYVFDALGTDSDTEYFYGAIGNPAIYNYALTQQQVSNHYAAGTTGYRYPFSIVFPTPSPTPTPSATPLPLVTYTNAIYRLNSDLVVDQSYTPITLDEGTQNGFQTADGHIYVGPTFSTVNGTTLTTPGFIRLNSDGTYDSTYASPVNNILDGMGQGNDGSIYFLSSSVFQLSSDGSTVSQNSLSVNTTGKTTFATAANNQMLIASFFSTIGGNTNYPYIARLNSDNTLDTTFPQLEPNGYGYIFALSTGKFIYMGQFSQIEGTAVNNMVRLNSDGSVDNTFNVTDNFITSSALIELSNGQILTYDNNTNLVRLNTDGSTDTSYAPPINIQTIWSQFVKLQDGSILGLSSSSGGTWIYHFDSLGNTATIILNSEYPISFMVAATDGNVYIGT